MSSRFTRRQLFRLGPVDVVRGIVARRGAGGEARESRPIRPPGALEEGRFLETCLRCGECAEACPHDAILPLGPSAGRAEGTPFLIPDETACHWCPEMDCVDACKSGALRLGEGEVPAPIAKAVIDLDACLVSQGILCDTCVHYCPTSIKAISMVKRSPVVDGDACVGCGLCSHYCSAPESAVRIVPLTIPENP